jgi:hypothetical protein
MEEYKDSYNSNTITPKVAYNEHKINQQVLK